MQDRNGLTKQQRILIADDFEPTRALLITFLHQSSNIQVIGEASNGLEAIEMTRKLHPDGIIMDIGMLPVNGIEACRVIHSEFPKIKIIGLSVNEQPELCDSLLDAGAINILSKNQDWESIISAIIDTFNH